MNASPPGGGSNIPDACDVLKHCAVCDGRMETVYERSHQQVCQCVDCGCTLTVPATAWTVAAAKRQAPAA